MTLRNAIFILLLTAALTLAGNWAGFNTSPLEALPGMLILAGLAFAGFLLARILPGNIPSVAYIVALATVATMPWTPYAQQISAMTGKVNFLALTTPILAYAGIFSGRNLDSLKRTGWRLMTVGFFVIIGTFVGSALIAHLVLKLMKQI